MSAVIIAAIIVSITSVQNYIGTADAPKKFYYYSQQLEDETGAVVDYALYSDPTGTNVGTRSNLNSFLQQGIAKTLEAYPDMELFACYTNATASTTLVCQNNGTKTIYINTSLSPSDKFTIYGARSDYYLRNKNCPYTYPTYTQAQVTTLCSMYVPPAIVKNIPIANKLVITMLVNGTVNKTYNVPVGNSSVQRGQFYFIATLNATGGQYVSQSNDPKALGAQ